MSYGYFEIWDGDLYIFTTKYTAVAERAKEDGYTVYDFSA